MRGIHASAARERTVREDRRVACSRAGADR